MGVRAEVTAPEIRLLAAAYAYRDEARQIGAPSGVSAPARRAFDLILSGASNFEIGKAIGEGPRDRMFSQVQAGTASYASAAAELGAAPGRVPTADPGALTFVRADTVLPERVSWLWKGRLAAGKITVLEGDPGVGKTTLALDIAASMTNGKPLPGEAGPRTEPRSVLVFSAEDAPGDTLRPRLEAAGADLTRVLFADASDPDSIQLSLPRDIAALEEAVVQFGAGLVIIDPVMSYLDGEVDSHKDQEVRRALIPLAAMAQRTKAAVLLLRHLNKGSGNAAIYRGGGSIAFSGVARLVLLAAKDPDEGGSYVLARVKGNLGRPPRALAYTIAGNDDQGSSIRWGGESEHDADSLLAAPPRGPKPETLDQAATYIRDLLAGGPKPRQEVVESGAKVGLATRTMDRAAKSIGVCSEAQGKVRLWRLP